MVCFTKILCSNKLKVVAIKTSCNEKKKKKVFCGVAKKLVAICLFHKNFRCNLVAIFYI